MAESAGEVGVKFCVWDRPRAAAEPREAESEPAGGGARSRSVRPLAAPLL